MRALRQFGFAFPRCGWRRASLLLLVLSIGTPLLVSWEGDGSAEDPFTATITAPPTGWVFDEGEV